MSRDIRISVDDDEVFEWMRRRKEALDLSWEEAIRRGLGADEGPSARPGSTARSTDRGELDPFSPGFHDALRRRITEELGAAGVHVDAGRGGSHGEPQGSFTFANHESDSESGTDAPGEPALSDPPEPPEPPEPPTPPRPPRTSTRDELGRLEEAEDAVLVLPGTETEAARVPLRVNLRTDAEGLAVEVVAVRTGRGTADLNRFEGGVRGAVTRALARGETGALELQEGAESYPVRVSLTWGRDDDGSPSVVGCEVVEVVLDEA